MLTIHADNVNDAWKQAVMHMRHDPSWRTISPRGNQTREYETPVATTYARPWRRVLFNEVRDANPFFHLMEALWMLSGRHDLEWIYQFNTNIAQFAERDGHFHGAYGFRWRSQFSFDQLKSLVDLLRTEPTTRRAVLTMWDPIDDLNEQARDIPCNTHAYFKIRNGQLHMTVCCRSNDIIWGCYGANVVHFSVLQEYLASAVDARMGPYVHISDSWHFYTDNPTWKKLEAGAAIGEGDDYYAGHGYTPSRVDSAAIVNTNFADWNRDLYTFFTDDWDDPTRYRDLFFSGTAYTMRDAWRNYKRGDIETAITVADDISAPDWRVACVGWLKRRLASKTTEAQE